MPYFSNLFSHTLLPYFIRLWQALSKLKGFAWTCLGYAKGMRRVCLRYAKGLLKRPHGYDPRNCEIV